MATPPLTTLEERVAFFQQLFSDSIPHNKALGIKVLAVARGLASMRLEWRKELVGNPETGVLAGGKISALAITEPSGGSDVANLRTTARRAGDHYVVNGSRMFITSGMRADYYTVAVRTGGPRAGGVSLLLI